MLGFALGTKKTQPLYHEEIVFYYVGMTGFTESLFIHCWKYKSESSSFPFLFPLTVTKLHVVRFVKQKSDLLSQTTFILVGMTGFEPATPRTPCVYATRLRHIPMIVLKAILLSGSANINSFYCLQIPF